MVPAAFEPIAKDLKVTTQKASYLTTCYTLFGGLAPLLITPYVNLYGRRPAYLVRMMAHCSMSSSDDSPDFHPNRNWKQHWICEGRELWRRDRLTLFRWHWCKCGNHHWFSIRMFHLIASSHEISLTSARFVTCSSKANEARISVSTPWHSRMGYSSILVQGLTLLC